MGKTLVVGRFRNGNESGCDEASSVAILCRGHGNCFGCDCGWRCDCGSCSGCHGYGSVIFHNLGCADRLISHECKQSLPGRHKRTWHWKDNIPAYDGKTTDGNEGSGPLPNMYSPRHSKQKLSMTVKSLHIPHVSGIWCCPAFERHRSCLLCAQILQPRFHLCKHQHSRRRLPHACGPSGPASCHSEEALKDRMKILSWHTGIFFSFVYVQALQHLQLCDLFITRFIYAESAFINMIHLRHILNI